jgi:integrase
MAWVTPVERKKGARWKVGWREDGKTRYRSFRNRKEAHAYKSELEHAQRIGGYTNPSRGRITLKDWTEQFLGIIRRKRAPSTVATYTHMLRRYVVPALGNARLYSLRADDIEKFLSDLEPRVGAATLESVHKVLRRLLRAAVVTDLIPKNPMDGIDPENSATHVVEQGPEEATSRQKPRSEDRDPRPLTAQQVAALADEVPPRFRALVLLMSYCGLRIGEASALRVKDLNLTTGHIQVVRAASIVGGKRFLGPTKNKRRRGFHLPEFLREELAEHLRRFGTENREALVFTSRKGRPLNRENFLKREFHPACDRIGLVPRPHVHHLRHTAASLALNAGANMKVVQEMLGHSSIRTTMDIYGHLDETLQEGVAARLDVLYRGSRAPGQEVISIGRHRVPSS